MGMNGKAPIAVHAPVLQWSRSVLTADDLGRQLNGHTQVVVPSGAIITPLAADVLRERGIVVSRSTPPENPMESAIWAFAQDQPHAQVVSAVQALKRDGRSLCELPACGKDPVCQWAQLIAKCLSKGECRGCIVFCQESGLAACVANKVAGIRAMAIHTVDQAARALLALGSNFVVVEMPGRTYFEVRQILRILTAQGPPVCPPGIACTLRELDGHAHR